VLFSHGPNKTVQVPDSCRATVTVYVPINLIQTMLVSALFRQFGSYFGHLGLQNKQNIHILSVNIKFICICCETGQKSLLCLHVSKACTNKFYISRQCTYIVYIPFYVLYKFEPLWQLSYWIRIYIYPMTSVSIVTAFWEFDSRLKKGVLDIWW
jgi:hypothetical protein